MKRAFFSMTLIAFSALGFAQPAADNALSGLKMTNIASKAKVYSAQPAYKAANAAKLPMKSVKSGNYYLCPKGAMYLGMDNKGRGFQLTAICPAGLREGVFVNMNNDPSSATWDINGQDVSKMVNDAYNLVWYGQPGLYTGENIGYYYYAPRLTKGSDVYYMPSGYSLDDTQSYTSDLGEYDNSIIFTPNEIAPLTYTEMNMATAFYGYSNGIYGFGPGTTEYGTQDGGKSTATNYGVSQSFDKPMSPLYVENIYLQAISKNGNAEPLKNGAKLKMKIYNSEDSTVIAELTAEMKDFYDLYNGKPQSLGSGWGQTYWWIVTFTKKTVDPILGEMTEPFVIDAPFTIEITGFDDPDIDCGFFLYQWRDENKIAPGYSMSIDTNTGDDVRLYTERLSLPVNFTALYDNVIVETKLIADDGTESDDNCNVLRIEDNGASSYLENMFDQYIYVQTATPWYNADGLENYTYEVESASTGEDTDWITSCVVNADNWDPQVGSYVNLVNFTATACPEGEGRWAVVKLKGRGVTSEKPIILLQGTAQLSDVTTSGIENVVNSTVKADPNAPVYNISGQRVSKDAKGILIQNGKKFMSE